MERNNIPFSITLPKELLSRIDKERGDVTRSRYLLRIIQEYFKGKNKK